MCTYDKYTYEVTRCALADRALRAGRVGWIVVLRYLTINVKIAHVTISTVRERSVCAPQVNRTVKEGQCSAMR